MNYMLTKVKIFMLSMIETTHEDESNDEEKRKYWRKGVGDLTVICKFLQRKKQENESEIIHLSNYYKKNINRA